MLIGKKKGSEVEVAAPGGAMEYEVLRVEWSIVKPRFGPVLVGNQAKSVKLKSGAAAKIYFRAPL